MLLKNKCLAALYCSYLMLDGIPAQQHFDATVEFPSLLLTLTYSYYSIKLSVRLIFISPSPLQQITLVYLDRKGGGAYIYIYIFIYRYYTGIIYGLYKYYIQAVCRDYVGTIRVSYRKGCGKANGSFKASTEYSSQSASLTFLGCCSGS